MKTTAQSRKAAYARKLVTGNDPNACIHAPCGGSMEWTCNTCELRKHTAAGTKKFILTYLPPDKMRAALSKIYTLSTDKTICKIAREALE